eukprot:CAMPEP_0114522762 /NCGR_PEP_ID=MMETSP0109-20121206/20919_1 /TAXON_ID=29199 /ORGANISM="Chlorarachnion reptans, Strain CCCM449" /LENGTH=483 /DNA_ID=CAMNT_0001704009 /DNA_START=81 /DNA_END=1532 /DNA_ORIENTATION=+
MELRHSNDWSSFLYGSWIPSRFEEPTYQSKGLNLLDLSESDAEVKSPMHAWDLRRSSVRNGRGGYAYLSSTIERDSKKSSPSSKQPSYLSLATTFRSMFERFKPKGLPNVSNPNRWLADHVLSFYNEVYLMHSILADYCTHDACPAMCAGAHTYLWADGEKVVEPMRCSAPDYANMLFEWIERKVNDDNIFPIEVGAKFPKDFNQLCKTILKKLFRVYAHLLRCHFEHAVKLGIEYRLSESFATFVHFVLQYKLVKPNQMLPMRALLDTWTGKTNRPLSWKRRMSAPQKSLSTSQVLKASNVAKGGSLIFSSFTASLKHSTPTKRGSAGMFSSSKSLFLSFSTRTPKPPNTKPSTFQPRFSQPRRNLPPARANSSIFPSLSSEPSDSKKYDTLRISSTGKTLPKTPQPLNRDVRCRANSDFLSYRPRLSSPLRPQDRVPPNTPSRYIKKYPRDIPVQQFPNDDDPSANLNRRRIRITQADNKV